MSSPAVSHSRGSMIDVMEQALKAKEANWKLVKSSRNGLLRVFNPVNSNGDFPLVLKKVSTASVLGLNLLVECFVSCIDRFDRYSQLLSNLADVACVACMAFGVVGSVMHIVVGILSIIQGAREWRKSHRVNGSRLFLMGAMTMGFGACFSGSFLMLVEGSALKRALAVPAKLSDLFPLAISTVISSAFTSAWFFAIPITYGLMAAFTIYENAYRVIPVLNGTSLSSKLRGILSISKENLTDDWREKMLECSFSSLGEQLTREFCREGSTLKAQLEDGGVEGNDPLEVEQKRPGGHSVSLSWKEFSTFILDIEEECLDENKKKLFFMLFSKAIEELEERVGIYATINIFRQGYFSLKARFSTNDNSSHWGPTDIWRECLLNRIDMWESAQKERLFKQVLHLFAGFLTILCPVLREPLLNGVRIFASLLTMCAILLSLSIDLRYLYERDVPVIIPQALANSAE